MEEDEDEEKSRTSDVPAVVVIRSSAWTILMKTLPCNRFKRRILAPPVDKSRWPAPQGHAFASNMQPVWAVIPQMVQEWNFVTISAEGQVSKHKEQDLLVRSRTNACSMMICWASRQEQMRSKACSFLWRKLTQWYDTDENREGTQLPSS